MGEPEGRFDVWRLPTFGLWLVFFGVGLVPEVVYERLRTAGTVVTWHALTNSPYFITVALAGYMAVFTFNRCRDVDLPDFIAYGNALQNAIVAVVAFLPFPLELLLEAADIHDLDARRFIYGVGSAKIVTWLYLLTLIGRYYLLGNARVFARIFSIFPSVHRGRLPDRVGPPKMPVAESNRRRGSRPE